MAWLLVIAILVDLRTFQNPLYLNWILTEYK